MTSTAIADGTFERYLGLLGVKPRPPEPAALAELVAAQIERVPFENISKLYHRGDPAMRLPPIERWLDGIEQRRLGGTCYANASHFRSLLLRLGYDARLCGADMSEPDVHLVSIVTLRGREHLVDVGYGAPFAAPMPLDLEQDLVIELGDERYVLRPRGDGGRSRMDLYRGGQLRHGYVVNPKPREIEEFAGVIERSFADGATFMNSLVIARFGSGGSRRLHNRRLVESRGRETRAIHIAPGASLPDVVAECFGVPAHVTREAIAGVVLERDAWG